MSLTAGYVPAQWIEALMRERRSKALYKPALLLVVLDMIDEGHASPDWVRFDRHLEDRFDRLVAAAGEPRAAGKAWQPFFHLSTKVRGHRPIWQLMPDELAPDASAVGSRTGLLRLADGARFREDLAAPLRSPMGRAAVREELYRWVTGRSDDQAAVRLMAAHNPRWPAVERAAAGLREAVSGPFSLFRPHPEVVLSEESRYARDWALRLEVLPLYQHRCALCDVRLRLHAHIEATAAHIVPVRVAGSDDVRNTLSLCRTHHWAFDLGLWCVDPQLRVRVTDVDDGPTVDLAALREHLGRVIRVPDDVSRRPHPDALDWHRSEVFEVAA